MRWATACPLRVFGHICGIVSRARLAQVAFPTLVLSVLLFTSANHLNGSVYTFTNALATGRQGPSQAQINTAYAGTGLANSVTINTQGIQEWTVPTNGDYLIQAWGAEGGSANNTDGGKGAFVSGTFSFQAGQKLFIIAGQKGTNSPSSPKGGGGGGGSFIYDQSDDLKLIAAGGGGTSYQGNAGGSGNDDLTAGAGGYSSPANGQGGTTDNGGGGGTGAGGGGWNSSGTGNNWTGGGSIKGGLGGTSSYSMFGGFGGGGGSYHGGGGGGGYSGGSGGTYTVGGGGGGSFNSGTNQNDLEGVNLGHGKIIITQLTNTTSTGSAYTFTNALATGRQGPNQSQIDANYSGTNLANAVTINTQGIQEWTVPISGTYTIEAWGASGGEGDDNGNNTRPGYGAKMKGEFVLTTGEKLKVIVGQMGLVGTKSGNKGGGGGGGSFVVVADSNTPLLVAAGGNGENWDSWNTNGPDGLTTNSSSSGGTVAGRGSGGGGFSGNGSNYSSSTGGLSFLNGGIGGAGYSVEYAEGGFGGGGGSKFEGGGGGGYSGGRASDTNQYNTNYPHYGAGSYNSGNEQNNSAGINFGHGIVTIQLPVNPPSSTGSAYTFTNALATGRQGPNQSQIDTNYSETNLANAVTINTQGIQEWTVPATGNYRIEGLGASGGDSPGYSGGLGTSMKGTFALTQGSVLKILVGQNGVNGTNTSQFSGGSGGGGTFVVKPPYNSTDSILIIAGGGGGSASYASEGSQSSGQSGLVTNNAGSLSGNDAGQNGNGGESDDWHGWHGGTGGAGFSGNGVNDSEGSTSYGPPAGPGTAFVNGGMGGNPGTTSVAGGF
jgi:hypothetical protein